jgi:DmsE family decaheme c-type cytochrome
MKGVSRPGSGLRLAAVVAIILLLTSLATAAVFHGTLYAWSHGTFDRQFLAAHVASMRTELARIHRGKVDDRTLRRILEADAQVLAADVTTVDAINAPTISDAIARHLAGGPEADIRGLTQTSFVADADPGRSASSSPPPPPAENADDRTYVGQKTCEGCHGQEAANWAHTIHAAVFTLNPRDSIEAQGCEACHGPGSAHVKNPSDLSTIISFSHKSLTPIPQQNAQCLSCHQGGQRIFWHGSIHENNNLACSDCHNPMSNFASHGLTARESINQTCFSCHKIQRTEFNKRSHMPLLEGKITCVDCHNPHGSTTAPLLKADSVNEVCYGCHAEKRGPFLFEHAPVRESCLNCHNPHGSDFEALLTTPRPMLCQQCHAQDGHPAILQTRGNMVLGPAPNPMLISTSCQTCHVNIHGSNDPSGSRFER